MWILLGLVLASRLALLATSPFEVDSVLLTRGVLDFDPTQMRPHPPGYAGLVFLAKALPLDANLALRLIAAFSALPLVYATWHIARRLDGDALLAAGLVAASPVVWMYGLFENAYAAGAAGAACTAWAALVSRERQDTRSAVILGLTLGITGALRPSLLVFLGPLAVYGAGRRTHLAVAGSLLPTLLWIGASALASGGLGTYLAAVFEQFTWIREGNPDGWRLHQLHHIAVYAAQGAAGAVLLLPWLRRVPQWRLLALWAGLPLAFHLFIYVAKAGYLVAYLPVVAILASLSQAPRALRIAAPVLSAAFFLLAQPIDVDLDRTPKLGFGEKTWEERIASEVSFLSTASLARVRTQDQVNEAYAELVASQVLDGRTTLIWSDRWDGAICGHLVQGIDVVDPRVPRLEVPVEGRRFLVLAWEGPQGFTHVESAEGYGVWVRDITLDDLPMRIGDIELRPVY
ncbi:MAG: hypothetical protein GY913_26845 [Proteobacteria bacterium]|nr:hypothetical protein [Pseudomonadota bacterium]MCP4920533.1 hypothetical protein [Pseudomonadota bacterium]